MTFELGDALWYLTAITLRFDLDLRTDVIEANFQHIITHNDCPKEAIKEVERTRNTFANRLPQTFNESSPIIPCCCTINSRKSIHPLISHGAKFPTLIY